MLYDRIKDKDKSEFPMYMKFRIFDRRAASLHPSFYLEYDIWMATVPSLLFRSGSRSFWLHRSLF